MELEDKRKLEHRRIYEDPFFDDLEIIENLQLNS